jgi:uncharacterized membrane protein
MIWLLEFLIVVALGVSLRRAFVRIDELGRANETLKQRLDGAESLLVALAREARPPKPARAPEAPVSPEVARGVRPASPSEPVPQVAATPEAAPKVRATPAAGLTVPAASTISPEGAPAFSPAPQREEPESLETQIGTRWLLYIGVIAIVVGVAYFEKLAIDKGWIGETARVLQGAVLGLVLSYAGTRFRRADYRLYGQMITGGGAAILYLSTYAAFNYYLLIDRTVAFALMIAITAMVAWLADREQSQGLALFAVGGGFATPFLLPGTTDAQIALFGYDAILIGATVILSRRRSWPVLNIVSYIATVLTVAAWAIRFYSHDKFLTTELFITAFCAMFLYILYQVRRPTGPGESITAFALWTAPAVYYAGSILILMDNHPVALLVWLIALMLAGGILSARVAVAAGLAVWAAVTLPLLVWIQVHMGSAAWLAPGLATVAGVYTIALAAQLYPAFERNDFGPFGILWLHLNGLLMFAAAYFLIEPLRMAATGPLAAAFAVWHWGLAAALLTRRRDHAIHFAALGFTLMSIAIALQFDGPAVTIGWAAEGAVVVALGLRERRTWLRGAGAVLFAIAFGLSMSLLSTDRAISEQVLFNPHAAAAAAVAALSYVLAWLHYRDPEAPDREAGVAAGLVIAQLATLGLLTSEIHAYWGAYEGQFARELMVSITWGIYATVLIVIGLRKDYAPIRYFAIVLFTVTILKVFFADMAELDKAYRVASIIGLGILLLVTSYLYTRSRKR